MKIKHKLTKDFQFITSDKKIFTLKVGTVLEEYNYKVKSEIIPIDREIVDQNPDFFTLLDWKTELLSYMKANKLPQPALLSKKMIPFIEEMVLSSMPATPALDEAQIKDLQMRESDLVRREKRVRDKEEEVEIRIKRVEKRENEQKEELIKLDKKEDSIREKSKELIEKGLEIEDKMQDLNERERNLDNNILKSSLDIDSKYVEMQDKIDRDLRSLSEKEKELEERNKNISNIENSMADKENSLNEKSKNIETLTEEIKIWEEELKKLDGEIKEWESLHWKFQRNRKPPSAI